jgi:hypothetical protein
MNLLAQQTKTTPTQPDFIQTCVDGNQAERSTSATINMLESSVKALKLENSDLRQQCERNANENAVMMQMLNDLKNQMK